MVKPWEALHQDYKGKLVKEAKDLGVCQRRLTTQNTTIMDRIEKAKPISRRINMLPLSREQKSMIAGSVITSMRSTLDESVT